MAFLVDTTLWIDFTRWRSPRELKELIATYILDRNSRIAEPIVFEILRHAAHDEVDHLRAQFDTVPMLATPGTLWSDAAELGQRCRRSGVSAGSLDLLIASVAIHHDAELVTFDADFERIAAATELRVRRLFRPTV